MDKVITIEVIPNLTRHCFDVRAVANGPHGKVYSTISVDEHEGIFKTDRYRPMSTLRHRPMFPNEDQCRGRVIVYVVNQEAFAYYCDRLKEMVIREITKSYEVRVQLG